MHNVTGIELFKTQALKGLSTYMADWPKIIATESITEELSRLLLPLAWRVRVEDTPAHRAASNGHALIQLLLQQLQFHHTCHHSCR